MREENQNPLTETISENIDIIEEEGCPLNKLVLGIPTYGRTYILKSHKENGVDAPIMNLGEPGPYTVSPGSLGFNEICEKLVTKGWEIKLLPKNTEKVAYKNKEWMSYSDPEAVYYKALYAKTKGLGGIMFWTIDTDDFRGSCYDEPYPLLNTGRRAFFDENSSEQISSEKL